MAVQCPYVMYWIIFPSTGWYITSVKYCIKFVSVSWLCILIHCSICLATSIIRLLITASVILISYRADVPTPLLFFRFFLLACWLFHMYFRIIFFLVFETYYVVISNYLKDYSLLAFFTLGFVERWSYGNAPYKENAMSSVFEKCCILYNSL